MEYSRKVLNALLDIHRAVGANLEIKEICQILVDKIADITRCSGCAILLIGKQKVEVIAEKGFIKRLGDVEFTTETPSIKYILNTRESIITGDVKNSPAESCVPSGCSMASLMCIPVIVDDEVKGIIHLDSDKQNAFSDEDVKFVQLIASEVSTIIERAELYGRVKEISNRDGLTGCFNRRKFDEDILQEFLRAQRYGRVFSLLMIDIDHFKKYNDFNGHQKGDDVLIKVVKLLSSRLRTTDRIYRYGGEEFAVLLPETDRESAFIVAENLRKLIENTNFEGEEKSQPGGKVTISIGVADSSGVNDRDNLIKLADDALYQAKQSGRNRVCMNGEDI